MAEGYPSERKRMMTTENRILERKPHPGIIRRLADRLLEGKKLPLKFLDASLIKEIFSVVFVAHSQEIGLIEPESLVISGDGSKLPTWASPYGEKICSCSEKCDCTRKLLDMASANRHDSVQSLYTMEEGVYYPLQKVRSESS